MRTLIRILAISALLLPMADGCHKHSKALAAEKAKDAKAKPYPLQTCIVTDEKLGEHGKPYVFTHQGQEIKLCCKSCLKDFKKEPGKYTKKIDEAGKK
jgi:hypothetical protein